MSKRYVPCGLQRGDVEMLRLLDLYKSRCEVFGKYTWEEVKQGKSSVNLKKLIKSWTADTSRVLGGKPAPSKVLYRIIQRSCMADKPVVYEE
jgi:hypothetical protein